MNSKSMMSRLLGTIRHRIELFFPITHLIVNIIHSGWTWLGKAFHKDNHGKIVMLSIFALTPYVYDFLHGAKGTIQFAEGNSYIQHSRLANWFGFLGVLPVSFMLLPVSRFSVFVRALKLSEINVLKMHIYAGTIALFGGIVHGVYYTVLWIQQSRSLESLFPLTKECWKVLLKEEYSSCNRKFVNLTGVISASAWAALGLTSLWKMRRRYYKVFYFTHVIMSIGSLFCMLMHWRGVIMYIAPGFLYYLASNIPIYVEGWFKSIWQKGVRLTSVVCIPDSGGCIEVSMSVGTKKSAGSSSLLDAAVKTVGRYVRLSVPEVSIKSHPFTIFTNPHRPEDITFLFRPCGGFTNDLSQRLKASFEPEDLPSYQNGTSQLVAHPKFGVNGINMGTVHQLEDALSHDTNVIFAGGVGMVSFTSVLLAVQAREVERRKKSGQASSQTKPSPKRIHVHWMCRENGLIQHVLTNHLTSISQDPNSPIAITVHHTKGMPEDGVALRRSNSNQEQNITSPSAASSSSIFDDTSKTFSRSIMSLLTQAAIMFGGLWIIQQSTEKRSLASKPIAVIELFLLATLVSIVSIGIVMLGDVIASRFRVYTKLALTEMEEIESNTSSDSDQSSDESVIDSAAEADEETGLEEIGSLNCNPVIIHKSGRPKLGSVLKDVVTDKSSTDVGIFFCGPAVMMDAVWRSVDEAREEIGEKKSCLLAGKGGFKATFYPEVFEM